MNTVHCILVQISCICGGFRSLSCIRMTPVRGTFWMPLGVWSRVGHRTHRHIDASPSLLVVARWVGGSIPSPRYGHPEGPTSSHAAPEQHRCSCALSREIVEYTILVFLTVKWPLLKSLHISGCWLGSYAMSRRWIGIQQA